LLEKALKNKSPYIVKEKHIENLLSDLIVILNKELDQYRILINTLFEQRKQIANGNISSLEEINKQQAILVLKIKTIEEARKSIISQLSNHLNIPIEDLTLIKLANLINTPFDEQLSFLSDEIITIIKCLENIRESNAYLIKQSLHYVNGVLKIFASSYSSNIKYSCNGNIEQDQYKGKLISGWG